MVTTIFPYRKALFADPQPLTAGSVDPGLVMSTPSLSCTARIHPKAPFRISRRGRQRVAGIGDDLEGEAVLFLHTERSVGGLRAYGIIVTPRSVSSGTSCSW